MKLEHAPEGTVMSGSSESITLAPEQEYEGILVIEIPKTSYKGKQTMELEVHSLTHPDEQTIEFEFTGPDARLLNEIKPN